jgi:hypothetical protein
MWNEIHEPQQQHTSILCGSVGIPRLRQTMAHIIENAPVPQGPTMIVPSTLIIAPTHLHGDWIAKLKGFHPERVVGQWKRRAADAGAVICNTRTLRTIPRPRPVWWRVVFDYTDPRFRNSESRRGAQAICDWVPLSWNSWCMMPLHATSAEKLYVLDILFRGRNGWMPEEHPELMRPTRRIGEYGQWLVDLHQWKLQMHAFENACANIQIDEHTVMVRKDHKSLGSDANEATGIVIVLVQPTTSWTMTYNAWLAWFKSLLFVAHIKGPVVTESLNRMCSTWDAFQTTHQLKSIVWDIQQAMCLLPIRLSSTESNGPQGTREHWERIKYAIQSTTRMDDAMECIICTNSLYQCPLVISDCGHIVGACCIPRLVDGEMFPLGYRCPECRRIVILGSTTRIVTTTANHPPCDETKIGVIQIGREAVLVITHYPESIPWIRQRLCQRGIRVTIGKQFVPHANHVHVALPSDVMSKDLSVFGAAYVYDNGPNVEKMMAMLHHNGIPKMFALKYRGTVEENANQIPVQHGVDHHPTNNL